MKKFVVTSLLIGAIVLYGGYSLISGSYNNNGIANAPNSNEITGASELLDNNTSVNGNELITERNNVTNNEKNSEEIQDINGTIFPSEDNNNERIERIENDVMIDQEKIDKEKQIVLNNDTVGTPDSDNIIVTAVKIDKNTDTKMDGKGPVIETVSTRTSSVVTPDKRVSLVEKIFVHKVKSGDNLWEIASRYNIDIDTLIGANDITNMNTIQIGDQIKILPVKGILYKVNPGESLWTIARQFDISMDVIAEENALVNPDLVKPGMSLVLPGAKPEFGYKDRISKNFISPINGRISSYYGPRWGKIHEGIDWAVNVGTEVRAARSGKVVYSEWSSGYGYTVVIEHQKGIRTLYAHNSKLLVYGGQWVERGQVISLSGNTGRSTGPHLHFEIQINGKPVNPLNYIQ